MSDEPTDFDLKMMPDWLKEPVGKNPYANYEGRDADRSRSDRPRRDFGERPRQRDDRGERKGPDRRGERRDDRKRPPESRRHDGPPPQRSGTPAPEPARVNIEFLPEPHCVAGIAKQVRTSGRAYPLFDLARMFLDRPERHLVRITSAEAGVPLFQCGEGGPVALDRTLIEKSAFENLKGQFYIEETVQREPLKGNFSNVARHRFTGTLLGPTNHHGYQPALRKLYEERFSRRMSFQEYMQEIEISTNPEAVEAWKEQARSVTTFKTITEGEPVVFNSATEAEQHFRKNHLEQVLRSGQTFEISGEASRNLPDRRIASAVKQAWENERGFPAQLMHHLRVQLTATGLHLFKHRKRMQFISLVRPERFKDAQRLALAENVAVILQTIESTPKCKRVDLANKILHDKQDDPELPKLKSALAADLHWLIHEGRVIEFHDGGLELPLPPKELAEQESRTRPPEKPAAQPAAIGVEIKPASTETNIEPVG